ncbi:MAG TPA: uracil phosphoribosyltransferase [Candidatus Gallacutalibacter stercoravium]|nr:uracil phosphoribosyltransferase [Candidatus Gallacutalibacter stercoravium]
MKIALGADHGGWNIKEAVRRHLEDKGIPYIDFGTYNEESVDYAPFAEQAAKAVQSGECQYGILCCGTGIGISIAANKVHGIRAAVCCDAFCTEMTRRHNDANILAMGGRVISPQKAVELTDIFLSTPFEGGRHARRVAQVMALEREEEQQNESRPAAGCGKEEDKVDNQVFVMDHPLIQHKLTLLRDKNTGSKEFRELVGEIAMLMCYEATRDLPLKEVEIETPVALAKTKVIAGRKMAFVPILRAGMGMVNGVTQLVPAAKIGHIGLYRDPETLQPVEYYSKLPSDIVERDVVVLDPMLATGGSAIDAISIIKRSNPKSIKFMCIIAAPEGMKALTQAHPDVPVYCAAMDECLNDHGYIVPGLGDAGDRIFGTK